MNCRIIPMRWLSILWLSLSGGATFLFGQSPVSIDYTRDVRPILSRTCYVCHGPDSGSREAELRLDRADAAFAKAASGVVAIVPGDPDGSELIRRITTGVDDEHMPPAKSSHRLTTNEIETLRRWISEGATFDDHWSFRRIVRPDVPLVMNDDWPRNPIDYFILEVLEQRGIHVAAEAAKSTLIRRLSFDLTGFPPAPSEVERFTLDTSDDAYERLVDRLLSSPHVGERWGRHWLDLAHYADSDGYLGDALRPNAWLYRDWVIHAINQDLPFDQFTIEQLAGDLLPDATLAQKTATGFLRNTLRNTEAGVDLEEYRLKEIVDRVSTIGVGWLGLSLGCAECHSHKYDPISQQEFYELFAFFNDANDVDIPIQLREEEDRYRVSYSAWEKGIVQRREAVQLAAASADESPSFVIDDWFAAIAADIKKRNQEQKELLAKAKQESSAALRKVCESYEKHFAKRPSASSTKIMTIQSRDSVRETYVHVRGDYRNRGPLAKPGTPAILPRLPNRTDPPNRLDFARWLVDNSNPLTARVVVNQFWARLFGRGLVASVDNFGAGGDAPSHAKLLNWLASSFLEGGWSRKKLLRLIVCSSTYRQSAATRDDLNELDPLNALLARQSRVPLEAEIIRDAALFSSGLLERKFGGPGIRPPQPAYVTSISRNAEWNITTGSDSYRRGMYIVFRRATPYPMLLTFDAPDSTIACTRRERSNSPLQALTLLNDPVFFECAQTLGCRLVSKTSQTTPERIQECFRCCLGRDASTEELNRIHSVKDEFERKLRLEPSAAEAIVGKDRSKLTQALPDKKNIDIIEEATWILIARVCMNVDEFITRE
ncbi:MAG: PSD1 and planctomycete cytochrome C domain-containing protein [Pirellulaceae bacterium]|nr:PSD1 and planctomycete cytochrome C domain-containing protein [Pirellulaceae bacterium]